MFAEETAFSLLFTSMCRPPNKFYCTISIDQCGLVIRTYFPSLDFWGEIDV